MSSALFAPGSGSRKLNSGSVTNKISLEPRRRSEVMEDKLASGRQAAGTGFDHRWKLGRANLHAFIIRLRIPSTQEESAFCVADAATRSDLLAEFANKSLNGLEIGSRGSNVGQASRVQAPVVISFGRSCQVSAIS